VSRRGMLKHALTRISQEWGPGGLKSSMEMVPAGFVALYPPYGFVRDRGNHGGDLPLQEVQRDAADGLGVSPDTLFSPHEWGPGG
jgi:hypothetical protein